MKHEIENELKELGANQFINKNTTSGFTVPEGYFDDLADNLQSNSKWSQNEYSVPEPYFSELKDSLLQNIENESEKNSSKSSRLYTFSKLRGIAAAVILLLLMGSFPYLKNFQSKTLANQNAIEEFEFFAQVAPEEYQLLSAPTSYVYDGLAEDFSLKNSENTNSSFLDPLFEEVEDDLNLTSFELE